MAFTLREIADLIGGKAVGNESLSIQGITNSELPLPEHIAFAQDGATLKRLEASNIAALIVGRQVETSSKPIIQVDHPKLSWAHLLRIFHPAPVFRPGISSQAFISPSATIGRDVTIEPFAYIGDHAEVGDLTVIRAQCFVGESVKVGVSTILHPGVKIYDHSIIGSHVIIHAGTCIGADGFGYISTPASQEKVPQVGNVIIEDYVELGSCMTVDRATIGSTIIGEGSKIDNLVQIGHNVTIGKHTVISAQTGISGSSKVGSHVTMGGKVGLGDHVQIGDWTMVGAGSGLPSGKKVPAKQIVFGEPARPYAAARKQIAAQLRSAEMYEDIKLLRKKLKYLEEKIESEKSVS